MAAFLFSCNNKSAEEENENIIQSPKKKIEVKLIGEVHSRKSYSSIQFMDDDKEIKNYLKKQEASNPTIEYQSDSISKYIILQFERLGLIKNGEILLKNFKRKTKEKTIYSDSSGLEISLQFYHNLVSDHCHFKLLSAADTVEIDTGAGTMQDLDYAFLDVIPGGNKELVFLDDWYIMNGDNFYFKVYEIRIN